MQHTMSRSGRPQFGKPLYRGVEGRIETMLPIAAGDGIGNGVNFYAQHTAPLGVTTVRGGGASAVHEYETTPAGAASRSSSARRSTRTRQRRTAKQFKGPLFDARIRWIGEDEELASRARRRPRWPRAGAAVKGGPTSC